MTTAEIKTIAEKIAALKDEYSDELCWGVRFDDAGLEVGHVFPVSRVWDDGEPTDETLNGTSCIQDSGLKYIAPGGYLGTPYIVCGYHAGYGEDVGEIILSECEIMATL